MLTGPKDTMGDDFERLKKARLERVGDEAGSFCSGFRMSSDRLVEEWKCQIIVFQHCSHAAEVRFLKL